MAQMEPEMMFRACRRSSSSFVRPVTTLVLLLSLLGSLVSVSRAEDRRVELPLLPPIGHAGGAAVLQLASSESSSSSGVEMLMIRLIRTFFGDQVKWSPFVGNQAPLQHRHHRTVREHLPNPSLQDELAKRRFRLRGKPASSSPSAQGL